MASKQAGVDLAAATQQDSVTMIAPEGCSGISVRGMQFDVPENGVVEAPADIAAELVSHGFTQYRGEKVQADDDADEAPKPRKRTTK